MSRRPRRIDFDCETCSEVDLRDVGSYAYARDPSTDVLCCAWAFVGVDTKGAHCVWTPGKPPPVRLIDAISQGLLVHAHNCQFDAEIWRWILAERHGWPWPGYEAFIDTQAIGQAYNLPGNLDLAAKFVGGRGKDTAGYELMLKMCKPAAITKNLKDPWRHHTRENLDRLLEYCQRDVEAEGVFVNRVPYFSVREERVWRATYDMNLRGVKVDYDLVDHLLTVSAGAQEHYRALLRDVTGGAVETESQRTRLGRWLVDNGARLPLTEKGRPSFSKDSAYLIDMSEADPCAVEAFDLYNQLNNSSLSKLTKMHKCRCPDGRVRGMFRYSGAGQTGRWAGQDVQLQNLPRGIVETLEAYETALDAVRGGATWQDLEFLYEGNALDICSTLIRCCIIAEDGYQFAVADYSAIEGRVLAWEAEEREVLQAYREGKRMYAVDAAAIFRCSYEQVMAEKAAGDSKKDKVGKVANLALGYQGSLGAFLKMGGRKLGLDEARIAEIVTAWRENRAKTCNYWYDLQKAAQQALERPGRSIECGPVAFGCNDRDLMMRLPSGRRLYYHRAHVTEKVWPDGGTSPQITYYGVDNGRAGWINAYGGSLCENATQAIARDLLADATVRAAKAGYRLVMTVHDELVSEEPLSGRDHTDLCALMAEKPAWAEGIPVRAEGFSGTYYRKG